MKSNIGKVWTVFWLQLERKSVNSMLNQLYSFYRMNSRKKSNRSEFSWAKSKMDKRKQGAIESFLLRLKMIWSSISWLWIKIVWNEYFRAYKRFIRKVTFIKKVESVVFMIIYTLIRWNCFKSNLGLKWLREIHGRWCRCFKWPMLKIIRILKPWLI